MDAHQVEAELWKLGLLLSGDAAVAEEALLAVRSVQTNVLKLSRDARRRLVIHAVRDRLAEGGASIAPHAPRETAGPMSALAALDPLQREAFVLLAVERLSEVEAARAMGITRQAFGGFASEALRRISDSGANPESIAAALVTEAERIDPASSLDSVESRLRPIVRRKRVVALVQVLALLAVLGFIAWIGTDLMRAADQERGTDEFQNSFSNPMTPEEQKALRSRQRAPTEPPAGRELPRDPRR